MQHNFCFCLFAFRLTNLIPPGLGSSQEFPDMSGQLQPLHRRDADRFDEEELERVRANQHDASIHELSKDLTKYLRYHAPPSPARWVNQAVAMAALKLSADQLNAILATDCAHRRLLFETRGPIIEPDGQETLWIRTIHAVGHHVRRHTHG